jgi:hypothetical protein
MVQSGLVVPSQRQSLRSPASISMTGFIQRSRTPSLSDGVLDRKTEKVSSIKIDHKNKTNVEIQTGLGTE